MKKDVHVDILFFISATTKTHIHANLLSASSFDNPYEHRGIMIILGWKKSVSTFSWCLCCRCTLIVLAERKEVGGAATYNNDAGVKLVTATNRRNSPQCLDSVIHHNNLLNNILVCMRAR